MVIKPKVNSLEALQLIKRMRKEIREIDDKRKYEQITVCPNRMDLHNWGEALAKIEERLQWDV